MKSFRQKMIGMLLIATGVVVISSCSNQQEEKRSSDKHNSDTVVIQLMQFSPAKLNMQEGDTVTWINRDLVDHNVKDTLNNLFYSDTLKNGSSYRWIVTAKANYICTIHPTMGGEIDISD